MEGPGGAQRRVDQRAGAVGTARGCRALRDRFFSKLDGLVGMAGRGLLLPRDPAILR